MGNDDIDKRDPRPDTMQFRPHAKINQPADLHKLSRTLRTAADHIDAASARDSIEISIVCDERFGNNCGAWYGRILFSASGEPRGTDATVGLSGLVFIDCEDAVPRCKWPYTSDDPD